MQCSVPTTLTAAYSQFRASSLLCVSREWRMDNVIVDSDRTMIDRKSSNFLWCPVFKAASTNWMENIIHLSGLTEKEKKRLEQRYKR